MQQISVFIENTSGSLVRVLDILEKEEIQLRGINVAETAEYGICRMVCNDPEKAFAALSAAGFAVSKHIVKAIPMPDRPGGAAEIVRLVTEAGLSLAYFYSFALEGRNMLAFRTEDPARATEILLAAGISEIL